MRKTRSGKTEAQQKAGGRGMVMKRSQNKPSDEMALYRAVTRYIESRGGNLVVAGGVQIQRWPGDFKYNFILGIKITGKPPCA